MPQVRDGARAPLSRLAWRVPASPKRPKRPSDLLWVLRSLTCGYSPQQCRPRWSGSSENTPPPTDQPPPLIHHHHHHRVFSRPTTSQNPTDEGLISYLPCFCCFIEATDLVGRGRRAGPARVQTLAVPEDIRSRGEVLYPTHEFVACPFVQAPSLEVVARGGRSACTRAPPPRPRQRRGAGPKPAAPVTRLHPQARQLAAVAPRPAADAGDDPAVLADEDRQLDLVPEPHGVRRLTADLRLEESDVVRIRIVLDLELHRAARGQSTSCSISETSSKYVR